MNLLEEVKITRVMTAQAAGTGDTLSSDVSDNQGFEGIAYIVMFGTITSGAATAIKVQQGAASNLSDGADLEGSGQTVHDDHDNKVHATEIIRPRERYTRLQITRATQNAVIDGVLALQYGARVKPVTHDATSVPVTEIHASPAEGTA